MFYEKITCVFQKQSLHSKYVSTQRRKLGGPDPCFTILLCCHQQSSRSMKLTQNTKEPVVGPSKYWFAFFFTGLGKKKQALFTYLPIFLKKQPFSMCHPGKKKQHPFALYIYWN